MTKQSLRKNWISVGIVVLVLGIGGIAYRLMHSPPEAQHSDEPAEKEQGIVAHEVDGVIHLKIPESIAKVSRLRWEKIQNGEWQDERVIPAKLELDPGRHFAVTAPADVIVEELLCPLGSQVVRGAPLIEMSSSQITTLRGGLVRQQLLTEKANKSVAWHKDIQSRIENIIQVILSKVDEPADEWESPNAERTADFGAKIVSAYAKYWAATQIAKISDRASAIGVTPERAMVERLIDRESAKANLKGTIEQARFEIQQAVLAAESELASAEGSLQSIQSDIRKYLGMKNWDNAIALQTPRPEWPDRFVHRSPGDGVVLERYFANGERATVGELVVLVADISKLWLIGDLRVQDWDLLQLHAGDGVQAEIVGMESMGRITAQIEMVGGIVQANSGSIRLTASLDNSNNQLRPGMISRLILSRTAKGIRVPASSIFTNDGIDYVVCQVSETESLLKQVKIGSRKQDAVEILDGISDGDIVLVDGVFPVASQAFLEKE